MAYRFVKTAVLCCWTVAVGVELTYPTTKNAADGTAALTLGLVSQPLFFGDSFGFNGGSPGPTLRMKPGESLTVALTNSLTGGTGCSSTSGSFCDSSVTNFHTHGLHVSSKGVSDGLEYDSDNVLAVVASGETKTFRFTIPDAHMGGTHWYHPHHHHATALQAGGGAAGLLIVEDPAGYLPDAYANMVEKLLFISGHNLNTLQQMAVAANAPAFQTANTQATAAGSDTNLFLVNGQAGPTLSLEGNTWYRFRMCYAAVEQSLTITIGAGATCSMQLLAKDGVYLNTLPRSITSIHLYPGARADVAISCSCATYPCEATISSAAGGGRGRGGGRRLQRGGRGGQGPAAGGADAATVDLMTLSISEGAVAAPTLPIVSVQRPCYLADLRSATVTGTGTLSLNGGARRVQWNGQGQSMTYANVHANGGSMTTWEPLITLQAGEVYEISVTGANAHPFHIHVNPYQIVGMGADSYSDGYFMVGDWHDTALIAENTGNLVVRYHTDLFTGKIIMHCHILEHEDEGMMGMLTIAGTEGAIFAAAESLDPTCYRTAFAGTWKNGTSAPDDGVSFTISSAALLLGRSTLLSVLLISSGAAAASSFNGWSR